MPIEVRDVPVPVIAAPAKVAKSGAPALLIPGYQLGPTAAEREKAQRLVQALSDPVRDLYAPLGILAREQYYKHAGIDASPEDFKDDGESYLRVMIR